MSTYMMKLDIEAMQKNIYKEIRDSNKRSLSYNAGRLVVLDEIVEMLDRQLAEESRINEIAKKVEQGAK